MADASLENNRDEMPDVGDVVRVVVGPAIAWHAFVLYAGPDGVFGYDKVRHDAGNVLPAVVVRRMPAAGPTALLLEVSGLPDGRRLYVLHASAPAAMGQTVERLCPKGHGMSGLLDHANSLRGISPLPQ